MGKVGMIGSLRIVIYTQDHRPAHVHVLRGTKPIEAEAVFILLPPRRVELREVYGFSLREVNRIAAELRPMVPELVEKWKVIHGEP